MVLEIDGFTRTNWIILLQPHLTAAWHSKHLHCDETGLITRSSNTIHLNGHLHQVTGARYSSLVRAFAHGAVGCWIDSSRVNIEIFFVPASAPRLVLKKAVVYVILSVWWDDAYKRTLAADWKECLIYGYMVSDIW